MIEEYDPLKAPDPEQWLETDEEERHYLIHEYHENAGIEIPGMLMHTTIHTVVENQIAMGDETLVPATLQRLIDEGLDRHQALHAIGTVLIERLQNAMSDEGTKKNITRDYYRKLKKLTARKWRRMGGL